MVKNNIAWLVALACCSLPVCAQDVAAPGGLFEGRTDVGAVLHPGTMSLFISGAYSHYLIGGSGENMWSTADAFHFVWKKVSGDVSLTADITFPTTGGNPHKKAVLVIRQSLDADSAYVDAALHGNGLTSLQSRDEKGAATHEVGLDNAAPTRLRIEKRGDYFYMFLAREGEALHLAGGSMRLLLKEPFYVGIGVCAHDKDAVERAGFSNVELTTPAPAAKPTLYSTLETITVSSTDRRVVYVAPERMEAPNWTPDGASLIFNSSGCMKRIPVSGGAPVPIDTGFATRCNNDHGISPDGASLAISDQSQEGKSIVYIVPLAGGAPRRITQKSPSYWHGWSPDGKTLAFCGERNGKFDVYTIPAAGGDETRLTAGDGHNDGPEYSPDGKYIYFNSDRTGSMQIWRMRPDGAAQEQVTSDDFNNWFPHLSPDGLRMAFLSYDKSVTGHPANKDVMLRVMTLSNQRINVLAKLFGGQGTMNVPSWSPDSRRLAFVSYQLVP
jgi:TolB protein